MQGGRCASKPPVRHHDVANPVLVRHQGTSTLTSNIVKYYPIESDKMSAAID